MAFISLTDNRAVPKGSRDPLGFELIWSCFGRKVVGNLTTITSSLDNFAVALLGFSIANELVSKTEHDLGQHRQVRAKFLCYEQLAAYLRYCCSASNSDSIMGITRVKRRFDDDSFELRLGQAANQTILSDQASYGLWGLYSSASSNSGLVAGDERVITEQGREIVDEIKLLAPDCVDRFRELIEAHDSVLDRADLRSMARKFVDAIQSQGVRGKLLKALLAGRHDAQRELWDITNRIAQDSELPKSAGTFVKLVLERRPSSDLERFLNDIQNIEKLLVACNNLFHYCRRKDGERLSKIEETLRDRYTYSHLPKVLPQVDFPRKTSMNRILQAFHNCDVPGTIRELIMLNKEVMQDRSGAPWVSIESDGMLTVKIKSEAAELARQDQIETRWDYDYFLGSFLQIARNHL